MIWCRHRLIVIPSFQFHQNSVAKKKITAESTMFVNVVGLNKFRIKKKHKFSGQQTDGRIKRQTRGGDDDGGDLEKMQMRTHIHTDIDARGTSASRIIEIRVPTRDKNVIR